MKYPEHQNGETSAFPVSELTRRLLRRATEPLGVINVRHAAELHSRSSLLPGQRLEFLNSLKSRYGTNQGADTAAPAARGMPFTTPLQRMAATIPFDLGSAPPWGSRTATPETAQSTHSKTPAESAATHYRVKRPNAHMGPNPSNPRSLEMAVTQSSAAGQIQANTKSISGEQLRRKTSTTQPMDGGVLVDPTASEVPGNAPLLHADPLPQVSELPGAVVTAPMQLQPMPASSAAAETVATREDSHSNYKPTSISPLPQVSELPHAVVTAPMQLQRMSASSAAAETAATRKDPHSDRTPISIIPSLAGPLPQVSELPHAVVTAPTQVQCMPASSAAAETVATREDSHSNYKPTSISPLLQVSELPGAVVTAPMQLQRMPASSAAAETVATREDSRNNYKPTSISPLPQVNELPRPAGAPQMDLQRVPGSLPATEEIGRLPTPRNLTWASMRADSSGNNAPTSSSPFSAKLHLQREADPSFVFPATGPVQTAETVAAQPSAHSNAQPHAAVTPEIHVPPSLSGSTSIVWRKAETNGAGRESATPGTALVAGPTYTSEHQIMRQAASESDSGGAVAHVATPTSGNGGNDVTRIAKEVGRTIARQLRIERERRGRTR